METSGVQDVRVVRRRPSCLLCRCVIPQWVFHYMYSSCLVEVCPSSCSLVHARFLFWVHKNPCDTAVVVVVPVGVPVDALDLYLYERPTLRCRRARGNATTSQREDRSGSSRLEENWMRFPSHAIFLYRTPSWMCTGNDDDDDDHHAGVLHVRSAHFLLPTSWSDVVGYSPTANLF